MWLWLGLALIAVGIALFFWGRSKSGGNKVSATKGSVGVGGDNPGIIQNVNLGPPSNEEHGDHTITILAILIEIVGIGVTVWHIVHIGPLLSK